MKYNFIFRLYKDDKRHPALTDIDEITISNITLIEKQFKTSPVSLHRNNQKKFGYSMEVIGNIHRNAGSHNYPIIAFQGEYLDIVIKGFPRFPCFGQDKYQGRNGMNGYINHVVGNGYPIWTLYRKFDIILQYD